MEMSKNMYNLCSSHKRLYFYIQKNQINKTNTQAKFVCNSLFTYNFVLILFEH